MHRVPTRILIAILAIALFSAYAAAQTTVIQGSDYRNTAVYLAEKPLTFIDFSKFSPRICIRCTFINQWLEENGFGSALMDSGLCGASIPVSKGPAVGRCNFCAPQRAGTTK